MLENVEWGEISTKCYRALSIIVGALLRMIIQNSKVASYYELMLHLDDISGNSRTEKLVVHIVIKSVFVMMLYMRAKREGDWPLHLEAVKQMMHYFYASMEKLPVEIRGWFMKGEHVMHHIPGL